MLFLPPGTARVHAPARRLRLRRRTCTKVVDFIEAPGAAALRDGAARGRRRGRGGEGDDDEDLSDEMYDMAVRVVTEHRQASISWLQRRLRVGYNRAARMIERMEREGVVSAASGAKGREVIAPTASTS